MLDRLTDTLNFQTQALVLRSERQRLIASNIANADTPGYKARDMDFATALREAVGEKDNMPALVTTQAGHIAPVPGALSEPRLGYALPSQTNLDSNSVDMDRERAQLCRQQREVRGHAEIHQRPGQDPDLRDHRSVTTRS